MTPEASSRGPAVIDTGVFGADLTPGSPITPLYAPLIAGRPAFISCQTVAELRFGAIRRGWGERRTRRMTASIAQAEVVWAGPELVEVYAELRAACQGVGHALGQRVHDADRWIAATAIRLGVPLVSHDALFANAPGLSVETRLR